MKKKFIGMFLGFVLGIANITPMLFQNLDYTVIISNFIIWIVIGLVLSISNLSFNYIIQGIIMSIIISASSLVYIAASSLIGLIWTILWTVLSGAVMGFLFEKIVGKKERS